MCGREGDRHLFTQTKPKIWFKTPHLRLPSYKVWPEYDGTSSERNSNELMGIFHLRFHHIPVILYLIFFAYQNSIFYIPRNKLRSQPFDSFRHSKSLPSDWSILSGYFGCIFFFSFYIRNKIFVILWFRNLNSIVSDDSSYCMSHTCIIDVEDDSFLDESFEKKRIWGNE